MADNLENSNIIVTDGQGNRQLAQATANQSGSMIWSDGVKTGWCVVEDGQGDKQLAMKVYDLNGSSGEAENWASVLETMEDLTPTVNTQTTLNLADLLAMDIDGRPSHKEAGATVYSTGNNTIGIIDSVTSTQAVVTTVYAGDGSMDYDKIIIKSNTIPQATSANSGKVYIYAGETNATYTHGYIYENKEVIDTQAVAESVTVTQTDNVLPMGSFTTNLNTFKTAMAPTGTFTYIFSCVGKPNQISLSKFENGFQFLTLTRDTVFDNAQFHVFGWLDGSNNYYFTNTDVPTSDTVFYLGSIDEFGTPTSTNSGWNYDTTQTRLSTGRGMWRIGGSEEQIALSDYGIYNASEGVIGNTLSVTYTAPVSQNSHYEWQRLDVQPAGSSLPSQEGQSGKFLTTDGTTASWAEVGGSGDAYSPVNLKSGENVSITPQQALAYINFDGNANNLIANKATLNSAFTAKIDNYNTATWNGTNKGADLQIEARSLETVNLFPNWADFIGGTEDFTLEYRLNLHTYNGPTAAFYLEEISSESYKRIFQYSQGSGHYYVSTKQWPSAATTHLTTTDNDTDLTKNWYHFALVRHDGQLYYYINGEKKATWTYTQTVTGFTWNWGSASQNYHTLIADLCLTKGAKWTKASFDVPTKQLTFNSDGAYSTVDFPSVQVAELAAPGRTVKITPVPASDTILTAPAAGEFILLGKRTNTSDSGQQLLVRNANNELLRMVYLESTGAWNYVKISVNKGERVLVAYWNMNYTDRTELGLRFVYAKGCDSLPDPVIP